MAPGCAVSGTQGTNNQAVEGVIPTLVADLGARDVRGMGYQHDSRADGWRQLESAANTSASASVAAVDEHGANEGRAEDMT